ncbi:hypothetical protein WMY93_032876 [Mugilogobius chulae]|uniref:Uncharacterized protein n=1 Tax=Mugilogobius chulae TaxID=88201 RepID=A0AAW0MQM3_9GOBI
MVRPGSRTHDLLIAPTVCRRFSQSQPKNMYAYPIFRRSRDDNRLLMAPTLEANRSEPVVTERARNRKEVLAEATAFVRENGGDPGDEFLMGKFQGQRFRWLLENSLGYAVYLAVSFSGEEERDNPLSANKHLFLKYTSQIRELVEEVEVWRRKQAMKLEAQRTGDSGCLMVEFGDFRGKSMKEVYEDPSKTAQNLITYLKKVQPRPNTNMAFFKEYVLQRMASDASRETSTSPAVAAASTSTTTVSAAGSLPVASQRAPYQAAAVKALMARGKKLSASQVAQKIMSPDKPPAVPRFPPPSQSTTRRRLFSSDTAVENPLRKKMMIRRW